MRELGKVYLDVRHRIVDLVRDGDAATTMVPACPQWSVHDVVAHLTGNCADILGGNLDGAATEAWTAAQVTARKDETIDEVVAEWDDVGTRIAEMMDDFPGRTASQLIADITTHEHDIRAALGRPGGRSAAAVMIGVDFLATTFFNVGLAVNGVGPLEVRSGECTWTLGTGGPRPQDPDQLIRELVWEGDEPPAPVAASTGSVAADPFELFRALTGRRSPAQIRGFAWTVDPEPFLPAFGYGPFSPRTEDLIE